MANSSFPNPMRKTTHPARDFIKNIVRTWAEYREYLYILLSLALAATYN
jgi:hypothetical protein